MVRSFHIVQSWKEDTTLELSLNNLLCLIQVSHCGLIVTRLHTLQRWLQEDQCHCRVTTGWDTSALSSHWFRSHAIPCKYRPTACYIAVAHLVPSPRQLKSNANILFFCIVCHLSSLKLSSPKCHTPPTALGRTKRSTEISVNSAKSLSLQAKATIYPFINVLSYSELILSCGPMM